MALIISETLANSVAECVAERCANGYLRIYDGTRPVSADVDVDGQEMLAELRFDDPAWQSPTSGIMAANQLVADDDAAADGYASWFRVFEDDGKTALFDGDVGLPGSGADITMRNPAIVIHQIVSVKTLTYVVRKRA